MSWTEQIDAVVAATLQYRIPQMVDLLLTGRSWLFSWNDMAELDEAMCTRFGASWRLPNRHQIQGKMVRALGGKTRWPQPYTLARQLDEEIEQDYDEDLGMLSPPYQFHDPLIPKDWDRDGGPHAR